MSTHSTPAPTPSKSRSGGHTPASPSSTRSSQKSTPVTSFVSVSSFNPAFTSPPSITLEQSFDSNGFTTRGIKFNSHIHGEMRDVYIQMVTSEREDGYGVKFVTLGVPSSFYDHLVSTVGASVPKSNSAGGFTWFNASLHDKAEGFFVKGKNNIIPVDVSSSTVAGSNVFKARVVITGYISRAPNTSEWTLRVKVHSGYISGYRKIDLPVIGRKEVTRVVDPATVDAVEDFIFQTFANMSLQ